MKICLVSYEYPPETFNGIGTYTRNLAESLAKVCEKVIVITFTSKEPHSYVQNGVNVHRINPVRVKSLWRFEYLLQSKLLSYSIAVSNKIKELLQLEEIDLIEGPDIRAELFVYLLRRSKVTTPPVVIKLHTPSYIVQKYNFNNISLRERSMNFMEKFSILHADSIYSPSISMRDVISRDYGISAKKIAVVPNSLDLSSYKIPTVLSNKSNNINILYTGRIEKRKGVDIMVRAIPQVVREVKNARFTFVGSDTNSGVDRQSLKNELIQYLFANGCETNFEFIDRVEKEALIKMYHQSDIFVIPSLYECFGYTCLEAMACGKPAIGSNAGGISEIIKNGKSGILVPAGDSEALARDIIRLCNDKSLRMRLGLEARKDVEANYSNEVVLKETFKYYSEVIMLKKLVGK